MHPPEDVRRDIVELIEIAPHGLGSLHLSRVLGISPSTLRYWRTRYGTGDFVRVKVSKHVRDGLWSVLKSDLDHTVAVRLTLGLLRLARLQQKVDQLPEGSDPGASEPSIRDAIAFVRTNLKHADPSIPATVWIWGRLGQAEADFAHLLAGEGRDPELSPAQLGLADDEDDVPLFDAAGLVATPASLSVGELLQDADAAARDLLFAPEGHQAAAMVRSWTPLVSAAAGLLQTLPGPAGASSDLTRELLERGQSLAAAAEDLAWPAPGAGDLRLDQITSNLDTAARLIREHPLDVHDRAHGAGPAALADVEAARAAALRALHMATHAVGIALREHVEARTTTRPDGPERSSISVRGAGWRQRAEALEQLLQPELPGFPRALAGMRPAHPEESSEGRLPAALEAWRVQANRVLANNPGAASLALIAKVQSMTAAPTAILASAGVLPDEIVPDRIAKACQETGTAWSTLADRWRDLAETHTSDPALAQAAAELRAACRELTHNPDGLATTEQLAARPGIANAARALLDAARHGPDLAARFLQATADPDLRGPAAAMLRRTEEEAERSGLTTYDRPNLRARGLIAPTALVRQALVHATATTAHHAETLGQAAQIRPGAPPSLGPSDRQPADLARLDDVDLENVDALAAELARAQRLCDELEEKLAAVKALGASLADRWSSSTWRTIKLDTAIAAIAESTAGLSDVESLNSALQQLEAAVAEARRLGEVIDDVGAYGTFPGPS